ncbi:hypothetical protein NEOLI_004877, partial [Neolecta irregularis DAH-3]
MLLISFFKLTLLWNLVKAAPAPNCDQAADESRDSQQKRPYIGQGDNVATGNFSLGARPNVSASTPLPTHTWVVPSSTNSSNTTLSSTPQPSKKPNHGRKGHKHHGRPTATSSPTDSSPDSMPSNTEDGQGGDI